MASEKLLPKIFKYVDQNVESYKTLLKEAVAIPSVSCDVKYREDCVRMVHWMQDKLKEVGASTELRDVGVQNIDGKEVQLPPVLVSVLGNVSIYQYFTGILCYKNLVLILTLSPGSQEEHYLHLRTFRRPASS